MTLDQFADQFFEKNIEIMKKKNHDYSGYSPDPFANFKSVAAVGVNPIHGFLTRMMDKVARIETFEAKGKLLVADENVTDTLSDLANYAMLLAGFLYGIDTREGLLIFAKDFFKGINRNLEVGPNLKRLLVNVSKQIWAESNALVFLRQLAYACMKLAAKQAGIS